MAGKAYDLYTLTAAKMFGIQPEEVTPIQRQKAKDLHFCDLDSHSGIIPGPGANMQSFPISTHSVPPHIQQAFSSFVSRADKKPYNHIDLN